MGELLQSGLTIRLRSGSKCTVGSFLGSGGEGEVYAASLDGHSAAIKWYFPRIGTPELKSAISDLIKRGPPSTRFLWPFDLAEDEALPAFGYVMPLRGQEFKGIVDLMARKINPSFRALATAGLLLADSYWLLHASGYCYRDISFGNVFLKPDSGDVLICDNDNVGIDNVPNHRVKGTPLFMAPEIVRGEAFPSSHTDRYSLAVLLFYIFMVHHPLDGKRETAIKCLDLPAMTRLYGSDPLFIYDPNDNSNRPDPAKHENAIIFWKIYPSFLRELFTRAFTTGLWNRDKRVTETEWKRTMVTLRDAIIDCTACGQAENFYDRIQVQSQTPIICWACGRECKLPFRIRVGSHLVNLNRDAKLYPHHTEEQEWDFTEPTAQVVSHPADPGVYGLKNLSSHKWTTRGADGVLRDVLPGKSVSLVSGTRIYFGKVEGEIRY